MRFHRGNKLSDVMNSYEPVSQVLVPTVNILDQTLKLVFIWLAHVIRGPVWFLSGFTSLFSCTWTQHTNSRVYFGPLLVLLDLMSFLHWISYGVEGESTKCSLWRAISPNGSFKLSGELGQGQLMHTWETQDLAWQSQDKVDFSVEQKSVSHLMEHIARFPGVPSRRQDLKPPPTPLALTERNLMWRCLYWWGKACVEDRVSLGKYGFWPGKLVSSWTKNVLWSPWSSINWEAGLHS